MKTCVILAFAVRNTYSKETENTTMVFQIYVNKYKNVIVLHLTLKLGDNSGLQYNNSQ